MQVWGKKSLAKKNNLYMEEWLTGELSVNCCQIQKLFRISRKAFCKKQAAEEGWSDQGGVD